MRRTALTNHVSLREPKCEFGKWFDEITIERDISLIQAEKMLGISHNALKEWRRGKSRLTRYHIAGIVKIFGVDVDEQGLEALYRRFGIE